jgi:hypothetical protein
MEFLPGIVARGDSRPLNPYERDTQTDSQYGHAAKFNDRFAKFQRRGFGHASGVH